MIIEDYYMQKKELLSKYNKDISREERKERGQFFTPAYIANFMIDWLNLSPEIEVLDPAFGTGIFLEEIIRVNKNIKFCAYEKDNYLYNFSHELFSLYDRVKIINKDYLKNWEKKYGAIICNPPYIIYKNYNNNDLINFFNQKLDINLSGFSNLYILFLLKSLFELRENGRMAYIIPSNFLNADYGREIKKILINKHSLRYVIILKYNIFEPITSSSILLFENKDSNREISFINIKDKRDFFRVFGEKKSTNISDIFNNTHPKLSIDNYDDREQIKYNLESLDHERKWSFYYKKKKIAKYHKLVPFSKYASVHRGIATGANDFFLFNQNKIQEKKIDKKFFQPCVSRASYIKKDIFSQKDWDALVQKDKNVYLLKIDNKDSDDDKIKKYIKEGCNLNYDKRYLTSHRNPWYSVENIPPAEILVKVFTRERVSFHINEAGVHNLTAFHCIYPEQKEYFRLLKVYLLTDIARDIIGADGRNCGNGLKKFEPNDIANSYIIDLARIEDKDQKRILCLYEKYRNKIINNQDSNIQLEKEKINSIFIKYLD
ncbi:MAG: HsdM family class I SAM-dependent methyltransferase [bacterium]